MKRSLAGSRKGQIEGISKIGGVGVAPCQARHVPTFFDQPQDGCRVVLGMINIMPLGEWRYDDRRDAGARTPSINFRRSYMVPNPAVFGVSYDNDCIVPQGALLNGIDDGCSMIVTTSQTRVAGMLVVSPNRLVE